VNQSRRLVAALTGVDAFLSAVPYYNNLASPGRRPGPSQHVRPGCNTDLVREQLALDPAAQAASISIIPDCGQVPGMGTTLMVYAMSLLDEPEEVFMWDAVCRRSRARPSTTCSPSTSPADK